MGDCSPWAKHATSSEMIRCYHLLAKVDATSIDYHSLVKVDATCSLYTLLVKVYATFCGYMSLFKVDDTCYLSLSQFIGQS